MLKANAADGDRRIVLFRISDLGEHLLAQLLPEGWCLELIAQAMPGIQRGGARHRLLSCYDGLRFALGGHRLGRSSIPRFAPILKPLMQDLCRALCQPLLPDGGGESRALLAQRCFTSLKRIPRVHRPARRPRTGEDAEERVVVTMADGIKLMVMAAGARDGEPQCGLRHHVDLIVRELHQFIERIDGEKPVLHHAQVRWPDAALDDAIALIHARLRQQITCDVLTHELIVGHVGIQRTDQIVAILEGTRDLKIPLASMALRIAKPVHPMPRPALAKVRRDEQRIDLAGDRFCRSIALPGFDKFSDFRFGSGQSGDDVMKAPQHRHRICIRAGFELRSMPGLR